MLSEIWSQFIIWYPMLLSSYFIGSEILLCTLLLNTYNWHSSVIVTIHSHLNQVAKLLVCMCWSLVFCVLDGIMTVFCLDNNFYSRYNLNLIFTQESETSSPICESVMVSNDNESSPQPVQQDKSVDHRKSNELSEDFFLYRRKQPVLPKGEGNAHDYLVMWCI